MKEVTDSVWVIVTQWGSGEDPLMAANGASVANSVKDRVGIKYKVGRV